MVAELDMTDHDVTRIADMIDGELASMVPEWRPGPGIEDTNRFASQVSCHNCASNHTSSGSLTDFLSQNSGIKNSQFVQCCRHKCTSMHGRFEEITFDSDDYDNHVRDNADAPNISSTTDCLQYQGLWNQHESRELSPVESVRSHSDEQNEQLDKSASAEGEGYEAWDYKFPSNVGNSQRNLSGTHYFTGIRSFYCALEEESEREIHQELRWLKAKYQMELRELRDRHLGLTVKSSDDSKHKVESGTPSPPSQTDTYERGNSLKRYANCGSSFHPHFNSSSPNSDTQRARNCEAMESPGGEVTAKSRCSGSLLPHSLHRTVSLPVDAVDM